MLFRQFFDSESSTYTYLIASGVGREALIIDPVKEQRKREKFIRLLGEVEAVLTAASGK